VNEVCGSAWRLDRTLVVWDGFVAPNPALVARSVR
jgi:hypothetical protein